MMQELKKQINERAEALFVSYQHRLCVRTDHLFILLFILQWIFGIILVLTVSPKAWKGMESYIHPHVYMAVGLGEIISLYPIFLATFYPGQVFTRNVIAVAQMLWSIILIHITGGRIETHFHIFGSLAFLAFYRDIKVFILPTLIVALDHYLRGVYWPQSVFGISTPEPWRWLEHGGWVIFEDCFLIASCITGTKEMRAIAERTAELEFSNQKTELMVVERTQELEASQEQLKLASKSKDVFLANMSHEIRTPLNGIIGMSSLLTETPLGEKQMQYVQTIIQSGKILLTIINDILEFSKIQAERLQIYESSFNIKDLASEIINIVKYASDKKHINLHQSIDPQIHPQLLGDPFRLRQVMINLLNNAIKFTEKGEVRLAIERDEKECKNGYCALKIIVSDTGIGIAKDKLDFIFEPFSQADGSITRKYGGTGLGLSIVSKIIDLMQGTIAVESTEGVGSKFTVRIMLKEALLQEKKKDRNLIEKVQKIIDHPATSKGNILVAEDNQSNQFVVREILLKLGYNVIITSNGKEAIDKLSEENIDLCLMDIQMPIMDGITATRKIRESAYKSLPIIALSASVFDINRQTCFDAGVNDFLEKPVHVQALKAILEKWIGADSKMATEPQNR